ncbi:hypothetical protein [Curtobacterium sp. NPDC088465]|uniref:hypothetical protein n=1 Tax=Curtobacterium sp. NPDC088465 TaxID=3363967 RepID=UPI00380289AB
MTDSDAITAQLRELIARALPELDDDDPGLGPEALREQSLRAVELCLTMRSSLREVTQAAVDGARRNGASWAAIGQILGSSRQAAQQMYGSAGVDAAPSAVDAAPVVRTLYPVTAFDEMGKLAKLGADGWHAIRVGLQSHELVQDTRPWEHVRVLQGGRKSTRLPIEGWTEVPGGTFPWVYFTRPVPSGPRDSTRR